MSERDPTNDTDCPVPGGHRHNADGQCEWCDAEKADELVRKLEDETPPVRETWADDAVPETLVLRALADSADRLMIARKATKNGLLDDHCANALVEIKIAMHMAVNGLP